MTTVTNYTFAEPLLGFPNDKHFELVAQPGEDHWFWIQALPDGFPAFLVVNPFAYIDDYSLDIDSDTVAKLSLDCPEDALVFTIVNIDAGFTANLAAPLVLNSKNGLALQVINDNAPTVAALTGERN